MLAQIIQRCNYAEKQQNWNLESKTKLLILEYALPGIFPAWTFLLYAE